MREAFESKERMLSAHCVNVMVVEVGLVVGGVRERREGGVVSSYSLILFEDCRPRRLSLLLRDSRE